MLEACHYREQIKFGIVGVWQQLIQVETVRFNRFQNFKQILIYKINQLNPKSVNILISILSVLRIFQDSESVLSQYSHQVFTSLYGVLVVVGGRVDQTAVTKAFALGKPSK